ncbi:M4 family metallopeptidase [Microbacterium fluvii]|uniref:Neutral metalloproteinase n=1 Tax=Microbacterium fluvii TaxID=415215 RepID=A0ABW2H959_9MICO|nr:M4 family metallopeptidase [Microbacterium fluvii]MCU4671503.1 M4 family metallopeptidase [Microbacterium fluvii]
MHAIVPPYLLARVAASAQYPKAAEAARATLAVPRGFHPVRSRLVLSIDETGALVAETAPSPDRTISDAQNTETLPGLTVRTEDAPATGDEAADQAFDGLGATFAFWWDAYRRNSVDAAGEALLATVHYGTDYDNAFWNGERMVFGDGDGEVFTGFTGSLTVIAHELAHAVTEHTAALVYSGQSGALNESVSDVFGALVEQHSLGQTADAASWLIGVGIFTEAVQGVALRSMKAPGTAYDDDVLGRDPQPAHVDDYVDTIDDNGGVHINSGIPNHAFYLAATALGGRAWERAGLVWYRTLTGGTLSSTATFAQFAQATVEAAAAEFGESSVEADAVATAWRQVGVLAAEGPTA